MSWNWSNLLRSCMGTPSVNVRKPVRRQLALEAFEDRAVPAIIAISPADNQQSETSLIGLLKTGDEAGLLPAVRTENTTLTNPQDQGADGLLLPAVQKVREAAGATDATDAALIGLLKTGDEGGLLPAVKTEDSNTSTVNNTPQDNNPDSILVGMLLPAVQKVREAAAR